MTSKEPPAVAAAELVEAMVSLQQRVAAAQADLAALVVLFADRRIADDEACSTAGSELRGRARPGEFVADEVSLALRMSVWEAQRLLARSRRLRTGLPTVWAAGLAGRLDESRLVRIDRAARLVLDPHVLAMLDEQVVAVAANKTVKQLVVWLQRFLAVHEPDAYAHRHQVSYADRNVCVRPSLEGVSYLTALVSAPDAGLIDTRLDSLARSCGAADPRSLGQRRADLFADLLLDRVTVTETRTGPDSRVIEVLEVEVLEVEVIDPDTGEYLGTRMQPVDADGEPVDIPAARVTLAPREGVPASIGVIVPMSSLCGDTDLPGQLTDRSACLPAEQVRDLAAQPGTLFYRLLTDEQGHLLDVTRMGRFATGQLGFAVRLRAGTCGFPTCTVPADRCDLDHHEPAPRGPTTAANLDPASRRHHRAKTHAGFHSWRERHETFWTTPTGHTYRCLDEPLL